VNALQIVQEVQKRLRLPQAVSFADTHGKLILAFLNDVQRNMMTDNCIWDELKVTHFLNTSRDVVLYPVAPSGITELDKVLYIEFGGKTVIKKDDAFFREYRSANRNLWGSESGEIVFTPVADPPGLNDLFTSGDFNGSADVTYTVVATAGNTYEWQESGGAWTTGVAMVAGTAQLLSRGVYITFAAATGHTTNDSWAFTAKVQTRGEPLYWRFYGKSVLLPQIEIAPIPDQVYTLRVELTKKPPMLVNAADVPVLDTDTCILGTMVKARSEQGENFMSELEEFKLKLSMYSTSQGDSNFGESMEPY